MPTAGWQLCCSSVIGRWDALLPVHPEDCRHCRPQGTFEKLPGKVAGLPFCEQYSRCTCCRPRHALTVKEELAAMSLSPACLATTSTLKCRSGLVP